jgi:hypothetical protein
MGSTRIREWALRNLFVTDGEPTPSQLAPAPPKPESLSWDDIKAQWRDDVRVTNDRAVRHYFLKASCQTD